MRMIAAATLILLPLGASAAPIEPQPQAPATVRAERPAATPTCDRFARVENAQSTADAVLTRPVSRAQRLGELPAGDLSLTVQRSMGGCVEPVIVREGYGAFGERSRRR